MLALRSVTPSDCKLIWEWANDPITREVSFSTEPIPWEAHQAWFAARLADPHTVFLIVEADGIPVAQLRFTLAGSDATVSIAVAPAARRKGHGLASLRAGAVQLFADHDTQHIHAYVKAGNQASLDLFRRAGYSEVAPATIAGVRAYHFIMARPR